MKRLGLKEAALIGLGLFGGGAVSCAPSAADVAKELAKIMPTPVATPTAIDIAALARQFQPTFGAPTLAPEVKPTAITPRVAATKPAVAVAPTQQSSEAQTAALLKTPEGRAQLMRTSEDVYRLIFQPCKSEIAGCKDLQKSEITPEIGDGGRIVGWRVLRERDARQNFIPPFFVRLPAELGMQFGFMHLKSDRNTLGLTASEANMLGYQANHVGSGIPSGETLPVEGFTIYFDMSDELARLANQTGPQRRVGRQ